MDSIMFRAEIGQRMAVEDPRAQVKVVGVTGDGHRRSTRAKLDHLKGAANRHRMTYATQRVVEAMRRMTAALAPIQDLTNQTKENQSHG